MGLTSKDSTPGLEINQIKREVAALRPSLPSAFRNPHSTCAPGQGFGGAGGFDGVGVFVAQGVKAGGGQGLLLAANAPQ